MPGLWTNLGEFIMPTRTSMKRESGKAHSRHRRAATVRDKRERMNGLQEAVKEGAGKVREAVVEAVEEVWGRLNDAGSDAGERARDRIGSLRDSASEYLHEGRSRAHDLQTALARRIRTQPLTSVLVAAGVGCL